MKNLDKFRQVRQKKWYRITEGIVILLLCSIILYLSWRINPSDVGFTFCGLNRAFGINCPGCGMTRAFHSIMHLDFLSAIKYNIFSPILFLFFAFTIGHYVFSRITGRVLIKRIPETPIIIVAILMLIFGVVRNLPFEPFSYLKV